MGSGTVSPLAGSLGSVLFFGVLFAPLGHFAIYATAAGPKLRTLRRSSWGLFNVLLALQPRIALRVVVRWVRCGPMPCVSISRHGKFICTEVLGMGQMRYHQIGRLILYSRMTTTAYSTHTVHPNVPSWKIGFCICICGDGHWPSYRRRQYTHGKESDYGRWQWPEKNMFGLQEPSSLWPLLYRHSFQPHHDTMVFPYFRFDSHVKGKIKHTTHWVVKCGKQIVKTCVSCGLSPNLTSWYILRLFCFEWLWLSPMTSRVSTFEFAAHTELQFWIGS